MKILSLETTSLAGSVAAFEDDNLLQEKDLNPLQRSAQSLAPAIHDLLEGVKWKPQEVQLVAVTVGPGSFTGLRVGVTSAKIFAYAVGAEILGVNTLEAIAKGISTGRKGGTGISPLEVVLDAQRGELVVGRFVWKEGEGFQARGDEVLMPCDRWLAELSPGTSVAGPILKRLVSRIPSDILVIEESSWQPRASSVARLAFQQYSAGRRDDLWQLFPHYSRRSAAEEKLDQKPRSS